MKGDELDRVTRAQIRNLEERSAAWVAKHLVMAGRLIDDEPELAFQHALAASRRGGRLAAVREAVGLTAYAAGHYGEALREFRTFRRISGSNVHLPVMADCERGLGRPDRALDLARTDEAASLDVAGAVELAMVVSGARADLGQADAAVSALEIPQLDLHRAFSYSPRLFRAYADALDAAGRSGESGRWRRQADVAARALGIDEDEEPDIIDLGEDDDVESAAFPRVTDVVEPRTAAESDIDEMPRAVTDPSTGSDSTGAAARGMAGEVDSSSDVAPGADIAVADHVHPAAEDAGEDDGDMDEDGGADREASIDEVPAGRAAPAVAPPQTEMLFSMDDSDAEISATEGTGSESANDRGTRSKGTKSKGARDDKSPQRVAGSASSPASSPAYPEGQDVVDE